MRILISGGGVAGPALAHFLSRTSHNVTILEKAPRLLPHGQNVDISGAAITVIKRMGLLSAVRAANTTETGTRFVDADDRTIVNFPLIPGRTGSITSEFEILRADMARLLYEDTIKRSNVTWKFGTSVEKVLANTKESVTVQLSSPAGASSSTSTSSSTAPSTSAPSSVEAYPPPNNQQREQQSLDPPTSTSTSTTTESYDLLIASDGQYSKLRTALFPPHTTTLHSKNMFAIYYTIPRLPADPSTWNIYLSPHARILTTRPDPHGTYRACLMRMASSPSDSQKWQNAARSGDRAQQIALVRSEFADAGWQAQRLMDALPDPETKNPDFYFQAIQQVKMERWFTDSGRVVCLGDAAYAPTPLTGQGTSLALIGAYCLAGELSKLPKGENPMRALLAYEGSFRAFVEQVQHIPWFVPGLMFPGGGMGRWAILGLLKAVARVLGWKWVRERALGTPEERTEGMVLPRYEALGKGNEREAEVGS